MVGDRVNVIQNNQWNHSLSFQLVIISGDNNSKIWIGGGGGLDELASINKKIMQALIVIDVQNEFSQEGKRPVPGHTEVLRAIQQRVLQARNEGRPIAWVRHYNKPEESPAFVPGTWGAEFSDGFGPAKGNTLEVEFHKDVYGAFTGTDIGKWLEALRIDEVLITGFYTHGCVSTTAREAIMRGLAVYLDVEATGTCAMQHETLGELSANEAKRVALLHLLNMGAHLLSSSINK